MRRLGIKASAFFRAQPVLVIAFAAALVTMFIIPPDRHYGGYINRTVLIQLFALMASIAGLREAGIFDSASDVLIRRAGNVRRLAAVLALLCFFSSMLVTNDVALITFVPLTLLIFRNIPDEKNRILTIVLETAAANLGSMMTPVGNPQNLYIYDEFGLTALDFVKAALPAGLLGIVCVLLITLFLPREKCAAEERQLGGTDIKKALLYGALFVVCLLSVFRVVPDLILLAVVTVVVLIADRRLLFKVDYALLATFVCFFIFVGNIARIDAVNSFFSHVVTGRELVVSVLLSQVISNVPAAVMLAGFTDNGTQLMLGVDIGGLGTIIASLASLISFQFYRKAEGAKTGRYMLTFSVVNFSVLAIILTMELLIG